MTLAELRTMTLACVHEGGGGPLSAARLNLFVNAAMQHVVNLLIAQDAGQVSQSATITISNPDSDWRVFSDTYARQVISAQRLGLGASDAADLEVTTHGSAVNKVKGVLQERPRIFIAQRRIAFLEPISGIQVAAVFAPEVPDMTADTDRPGQAGGSGEEVLPPGHQVLIPSFAAILALTAENSDATRWQTLFDRQATALGLALAPERKTRARN